MRLFAVFFSVGCVLSPEIVFAKTVRYELDVTQKAVNLSGRKVVDFALAVNGSIPAPTLEFTEGDEAEIKVINNIPTGEDVSIHWHGILLPPEEDGVPYVNTPPIFKGKSHTFRFKLRQHGTYWYHSHTALQEQKGVYGAIVVHPKDKKIQSDKDLVVVLSDWSDENADQILRNLRKDGDYYLFKKDSIRSYWGAIQAGQLSSYLGNEWMRMGGMDLSDVGYDAFLINGKKNLQLAEARPGEKVRLRIINAAASSYFYVSLGKLPMTVIAADGIDVEPVLAKELLIGMAETYDILFTVPEQKNYELRATVQDVTGYASAWIGSGEKVSAADKPLPDFYAPMDHGSGHGGHAQHGHEHQAHEHHGAGALKATSASEMDHSQHAGHEHHHKMSDKGSPPHHHEPTSEPVNHESHGAHHDHSSMQNSSGSGPSQGALESLTVDDLKALTNTELPSHAPKYEVKLVLGGDMERYVWHINGKAIHEERTLLIREGDVVRFTFENDTMMHHPMHLHGHFFRVLNKNMSFSPLKHTVDVGPHSSRTIEFFANEPGEWMLHCHNLYHMKTGMGRVIKYSSFTPRPDIAKIQKDDHHLHDHIYFDGGIGLATNKSSFDLRLSKTWDTLQLHLETKKFDINDHSEGRLTYRRWQSNFFNFILGAIYASDFDDDKVRGILGFGYMLPLLIEIDLFASHKGELHLDLEKKFQWTKYIFTDLEVSLRQKGSPEVEASLMYSQNWNWAGGLIFTNDDVGMGIHYRF